MLNQLLINKLIDLAYSIDSKLKYSNYEYKEARLKQKN